MSVEAAREYALELVERMNGVVPVSVSRFFGGAGLVAHGVQFGFVMEGSLYLRVDEVSRPAFIERGAAPFDYRGQSKQVTVASYFEVPGDIIDDPEALGRWAAEALRAASTATGAKRKKRSALED